MWFIDSSGALHTVLPEGDIRAGEWFQRTINHREILLTFTLLRLEFTRVLRQEEQPLDKGDWLLARTHLIRLDDRVLQRAGTIEPHIRSLDAIHLAAALLSEADPTVVAHDGNMKVVADSLGIAAFDPLAA